MDKAMWRRKITTYRQPYIMGKASGKESDIVGKVYTAPTVQGEGGEYLKQSFSDVKTVLQLPRRK